MRMTAIVLLVIATQALSQDLATSKESCAAHLNASPKPKVEELLNCLMEMQRDMDELKKRSDSMQTEIEALLDKKIKDALSKLPDELSASNSEPVDPMTDDLASTRIIKKGQTFTMKIHEMVALNDINLALTVDKILTVSGTPHVSLTWSNSKTGKEASIRAKPLKLIHLGNKCTITPYKIDMEIPQVVFRSNC